MSVHPRLQRPAIEAPSPGRSHSLGIAVVITLLSTGAAFALPITMRFLAAATLPPSSIVNVDASAPEAPEPPDAVGDDEEPDEGLARGKKRDGGPRDKSELPKDDRVTPPQPQQHDPEDEAREQEEDEDLGADNDDEDGEGVNDPGSPGGSGSGDHDKSVDGDDDTQPGDIEDDSDGANDDEGSDDGANDDGASDDEDIDDEENQGKENQGKPSKPSKP